MIVNQQEMQKARQRLLQLTDALKHAIKNEKQYLIPITFDNHHNGNDEHEESLQWAESETEAINKATIGQNGQWCSVDGPVRIVKHTPEFSGELIRAILSLPEPL